MKILSEPRALEMASEGLFEILSQSLRGYPISANFQDAQSIEMFVSFRHLQ